MCHLFPQLLVKPNIEAHIPVCVTYRFFEWKEQTKNVSHDLAKPETQGKAHYVMILGGEGFS